MSRFLGYARVSRDDQNLELQISALLTAGCREALIFTDKVSGAKSIRPGLDQCLEELKSGDTLIVWRLDRLGRSMSHLVKLIEDLREDKSIKIEEICKTLRISRPTLYRYLSLAKG